MSCDEREFLAEFADTVIGDAREASVRRIRQGAGRYPHLTSARIGLSDGIWGVMVVPLTKTVSGYVRTCCKPMGLETCTYPEHHTSRCSWDKAEVGR